MNYAPPAGSSRGRSLVNVILLLACAGLGIWAAQLWRSLANAETELAQLRVRSSQIAPAESLQAQNDTLRARVAELETAQRNAAAAPNSGSAVPARPNPAASLGTLASAMMNSPAMRSIMVQNQKAAFERRFADLMNQLAMSPEDRTRFIDLLVEKQMNVMDLGLKLMGPNLSDAERAAIAQQVKDAGAASDAGIRDFFGNDPSSYAVYQDYVAQQPIRTQVAALGASLAATGLPLSPEQSNALAGVMTEARQNFTFTRDFNDPTNLDPQTIMGGPAMAQYLQEQEQLQNQIAERAAAFMSPGQVTALRQAQAARLQQAKQSMEMARQMMGGAAK